MTKERLVEAITANNPDGIKDVIKAAKRTIEEWLDKPGFPTELKESYLETGTVDCMVRMEPSRCLLAWGWLNGFASVSVSRGTWSSSPDPDGSYACRIHKCWDVVDWFDSFDSSFSAAEAVLKLLKEYDES